MKLVCDSCGAKYSIGDDKVAGKVFKIRCKKCATVIVVRGAAAAPTPPPSADDWHAVIDGAQAGPFSRSELLRKHAAGEISDDTFVWREGMEEWAALDTLSELAGSRRQVATSSLLEQVPPDEAPSGSLLGKTSFDAAPRDWAAGNARPDRLFDRPASPRDAVAIETPADSSDRADAKLHGERNETSVLFTLGNLAKLAAPQQAKVAGTNASVPTEGSGLIDIRALAGTFATGKPAAAAPSIGTAEDLPVFATPTFGEPIALAPLRPVVADRRLVLALFATLAMLAILGAVLVLVVMRDSSPQQASTGEGTKVATLGNPTTEPPPIGTSEAVAPISPTSASSAPSAPTSVIGTSTTTVGTSPTSRTTAPPTTTSTRGPNTSPTSTNRALPATSTTPRGPQSTRTPTTPPPSLTIKQPDKQECTEVHCAYIDYADKCCEIFKPKSNTTITATTSSLPENLDKDALKAGIATIRAQVCGNKSNARGDVVVSVKVSAAGTVTGVTIKGSPDPVLSSCVTAAAQLGTFAKTKRGGSFAYVWRF